MAELNVHVDLSKEVSAKLDDLRVAFETHKAECIGHDKPLVCASVNCDREGRTENKVQGKLDLRQSSDATGPSIWVEAYLCDVCMSRVREGQTLQNVSIGYQMPSMAENHRAYHPGCPCDLCTGIAIAKYRGL